MNRPAMPDWPVPLKWAAVAVATASGWLFSGGQFVSSHGITNELEAMDTRVTAVEVWRGDHMSEEREDDRLTASIERMVKGLICDLNDVESFRCDAFLRDYGEAPE